MSPTGSSIGRMLAVAALAALLAPLSACGRNGLATTADAANDPKPLPEVPASDPIGPADRASDPTVLRDLAVDPPSAPDLAPDRGSLVDLLPDSPADASGADVRPIDQRGVDLLPDLPADLARPDLGVPDQRDVDLLPDLPTDKPPLGDGSPDRYVSLDDRGAADTCTSSGGTVDTLSCCNSTVDFRDMCTGGAGACGCSPSNSRPVKVCNCPAPSCFLPGYGCVSPSDTCTVGMDQTCNDSEIISSIHGRCVADGRCLCTRFPMAASGKCS